MIEVIKNIIVENLDINIDYEDFDEKTPLFDGGISMDSIVFTEFILLLEKKFDLEFNDDELTVENFFNVNKISDEIKRKLSK